MALRSFFSWLKGTKKSKSRTTNRRRSTVRLGLEALEDRLTPSSYTGPLDSWMSQLHDDNLSLSQLSIPGTHDTMTYLLGGLLPTVRNQTMPLTEQLNAGIRFIDIRVGPGFSGDLGLYHADVNLVGSFNKDVVATCENFLTAHPNETIVMAIHLESGYDYDSVWNVVHSHVYGADEKFWYT